MCEKLFDMRQAIKINVFETNTNKELKCMNISIQKQKP